MKNLLYSLVYCGNLKIINSNNTTYVVFQKNGNISVYVEDPKWLYKPYILPITNAKDLEQFFDESFYEENVKEKLEERYRQHKVLMGNIQVEKANLLKKVENSTCYTPTIRDIISRILTLACENDKFYLSKENKKATYLTLADVTNKKITPYSDLHIQLVNEVIDKDGTRHVTCPEICDEQLIPMIAKNIRKAFRRVSRTTELNTEELKLNDVYVRLLEDEKLFNSKKEKREQDFDAISKKYAPQPKVNVYHSDKIIEA